MLNKTTSRKFLVFLLINAVLTLFNIQPARATTAIQLQPSDVADPPKTSWPIIEWDYYHNYTEIVNILSYLNDTYPNIVDLVQIGESRQNRSVYCVRLTNESRTQPKPEVFFVGGHHAREPISVELPLYFLVEAATKYGVNKTYTHMLDLCEIYVVVALNPDGLNLFKANDWQRKNACPIDEDGDGLLDEDPPEDEDNDGFIEWLYNTTSGMFIRWEGIDNDNDGESGEDWVGGVDLNRNYGFAWAASAQSGSNDPRDQDYKGPTSFSEPETQALRVLSTHHDFKYAVSFHSGADIVLYPWGYTTYPTPDDDKFREIASDMSSLISSPYEQASDIYTTSGVWADWMYGNRSAFVFTCEIFSNSSEWFWDSGTTPDTLWWGGLRYAFNPRPSKIENTVRRWVPIFTYITNRAIIQVQETNVAIVSVTSSKTIVAQGFNLRINLTVENQGETSETLNITAYANTTVIQTKNIALSSKKSETVSFSWNTTSWSIGNYAISAYVTQVPNETDTSDNMFIYGVVTVTIPGDVDTDFDVDIYDIVKITVRYGEAYPPMVWPGPPEDIDGDGDVDIYDVVLACTHYGNSGQPIRNVEIYVSQARGNRPQITRFCTLCARIQC